MKNRQILSVIICLIILLTTGCAETPEEDIVINKGDNQLRDKIENSEGSANDIADGFGKREDRSFTSDNGKVEFCINAKVDMPGNIENIPVAKASPHFFTSEEIEKIVRAAFVDAEIYEYTEKFSKGQLQTMILEKKREMGDTDKLMHDLDGNEERIERYLGMCEEQIAYMEADMANAPDEDPKVLSDFQYHNTDYYKTEHSGDYFISFAFGDNVEAVIAQTTVDDIPYLINVRRRDENDYKFSTFDFGPRNIFKLWEQFPQEEPFTEDDIENAKKMIEDFIELADVGDWRMEYDYSEGTTTLNGGIEYTHHALLAHGTQYYNNLPIREARLMSSEEVLAENHPTYQGSMLGASVENGRVNGFCIEYPIEISEVLNDNVALLPYDEIMERICDQLKLSFTLGKISKKLEGTILEDCVTKGGVIVDRIELAYVRTQIKDDRYNFYLLPAWVVYGDYGDTEYEYGGEVYTEDWFEQALENPDDDIHSEVLLTINAIDGSAIDMAEGY